MHGSGIRAGCVDRQGRLGVRPKGRDVTLGRTDPGRRDRSCGRTRHLIIARAGIEMRVDLAFSGRC